MRSKIIMAVCALREKQKSIRYYCSWDPGALNLESQYSCESKIEENEIMEFSYIITDLNLSRYIHICNAISNSLHSSILHSDNNSLWIRQINLYDFSCRAELFANLCINGASMLWASENTKKWVTSNIQTFKRRSKCL